jgi:hypothetical protein
MVVKKKTNAHTHTHTQKKSRFEENIRRNETKGKKKSISSEKRTGLL